MMKFIYTFQDQYLTEATRTTQMISHPLHHPQLPTWTRTFPHHHQKQGRTFTMRFRTTSRLPPQDPLPPLLGKITEDQNLCICGQEVRALTTIEPLHKKSTFYEAKTKVLISCVVINDAFDMRLCFCICKNQVYS